MSHGVPFIRADDRGCSLGCKTDENENFLDFTDFRNLGGNRAEAVGCLKIINGAGNSKKPPHPRSGARLTGMSPISNFLRNGRTVVPDYKAHGRTLEGRGALSAPERRRSRTPITHVYKLRGAPRKHRRSRRMHLGSSEPRRARELASRRSPRRGAGGTAHPPSHHPVGQGVVLHVLECRRAPDARQMRARCTSASRTLASAAAQSTLTAP